MQGQGVSRGSQKVWWGCDRPCARLSASPPENLYVWAMRATNTLTLGTDRALYVGEL
jgi:hypothetical protein